jgi:hypothetical protein
MYRTANAAVQRDTLAAVESNRRVAVQRAVWGALVALLLMAAHFVAPREAAAQVSDRAAAQALFDQAVALRERGDIAQACSKFAESLRLDPTVGTRFNLADCLERTGKLASAWSHFLEVVSSTQMAGQAERADIAAERAKRLEPRLTKLLIEPTTPVAGLVITRNGVPVGQAQWSTAVPVDAGSYRIEAEAPAKKRWSADIVAAGEGNVVRYAVPPLEDAPVADPGFVGEGARPAADEGVAAGTIAGLTIAGVGVVGLGIGTAFGVIAMSKKNQVDDLCPDETKCTADGIAINDEAKSAGIVSTIAFIAGGVLVVGGVVVWLATPSGSEVARIELSPTVGADGVAMLLRATF